VKHRNFNFGEYRCHNGCLPQRAPVLRNPLAPQKLRLRQTRTHLKQREDNAFEERAWLVKGSLERLVVMHIQLFVLLDVLSDGIKEHNLEE
jgi:hypothetical protein